MTAARRACLLTHGCSLLRNTRLRADRSVRGNQSRRVFKHPKLVSNLASPPMTLFSALPFLEPHPVCSDADQQDSLSESTFVQIEMKPGLVKLQRLWRSKTSSPGGRRLHAKNLAERCLFESKLIRGLSRLCLQLAIFLLLLHALAYTGNPAAKRGIYTNLGSYPRPLFLPPPSRRGDGETYEKSMLPRMVSNQPRLQTRAALFV